MKLTYELILICSYGRKNGLREDECAVSLGFQISDGRICRAWVTSQNQMYTWLIFMH